MKFKKIEVILTDNEGCLVLKGLLPNESILWIRSIDDQVIICLDAEIDLDYLSKNLNSVYRTLRL